MNRKSKSGFSLLETMISVLIIVVLAIGSAKLMYHTGADIRVMGNKHLAMERARTKMEWLRSQEYWTLRDEAVSGNPSVAVTNEVYNGITITISTTNRYVGSGGILKAYSDANGGTQDSEYLELSVSATYRHSDETVLLQSVKTK